MKSKRLYPPKTGTQFQNGLVKRRWSVYSPELLLFFLAFVMLSCRHERLTPADNPISLIDHCDVGMSYDAESTTLIMPVFSSDTSQLTLLDKALMLPQRERRRESVCLMNDGSYTIESEFLTPLDPIILPKRTVGTWPKPAYHKLVNTDGIVKYYNEENEEIKIEAIENDAPFAYRIVQAFQEVKDNPVANDEVFTNYIDALSANGLVHTAQGGNIYTNLVNHPDGTFSVAAIDKAARMKVGQIDFDQSGRPVGLYMLVVTGQAPQVEFKKLTQVIYFDAVESRVRMKMLTNTVFNSFSLKY